MDSGFLMAVAATLVVVLYLSGVIVRRSSLWYEWFFALAGAAFAAWFWFTELRRALRRRGRKDQ
ncbi:MAG TPA: hypothetical protein VIL07_09970 [Symbiobacteriaceae bacterium]